MLHFLCMRWLLAGPAMLGRPPPVLTARSWSWTGCGAGGGRETASGYAGALAIVSVVTGTSSSYAGVSCATWAAAVASGVVA